MGAKEPQEINSLHLFLFRIKTSFTFNIIKWKREKQIMARRGFAPVVSGLQAHLVEFSWYSAGIVTKRSLVGISF